MADSAVISPVRLKWLLLLLIFGILRSVSCFQGINFGSVRSKLPRVSKVLSPRELGVNISPAKSVMEREGSVEPSLVLVGRETIDTYDEKERDKSPSISMAELVKFGLPTLGIWLLQPILSLIDSSVVGMSTSVSIVEFAGLGPGIAWIDSSSYLMSFLGIAVTNLYANAQAANNHDEAYKVLRSGKSIAIMLAFVLLVCQLKFARYFIGVLAGPNLKVIPHAMEYSRIRAFGALAAVPSIAIQSAFLAAKDSLTPLVAVVVGAVVNLVGDLFLVNSCGMGIVGAAWATMLSQFASFVYLLQMEYKLRQNVVTSVAVRVPTEPPESNDVVRLGRVVDPETGAISISMSVDKGGAVEGATGATTTAVGVVRDAADTGDFDGVDYIDAASDESSNSSMESGLAMSGAMGMSDAQASTWGMGASMTKSRARLHHAESVFADESEHHDEVNEEGFLSVETSPAERVLDALEAKVAGNGEISEAVAQATTITATLIEDLPPVPEVVMRDPWFYVPTKQEFQEYFSFCGPVFCILLLKTSLWNSTTVAVAPAGAAALAAHQILINFFCYFVIFGDVLSQCSQTFLPALIKRTKKNIVNSFAAARKLVITTLKLGMIVGVFNGLIGKLLLQYTVGAITPSKEIHDWAKTALPGFILTVVPHACLSAFEGVIIAGRDVTFQSLVYFVTSSGFIAYQAWVQRSGKGLRFVWFGFALYQWARLLVFSSRVVWRMKRAIRNAAMWQEEGLYDD